MANQETQKLDTIISSRRAMLAVGGAALAGLAFAPKAKAQTTSAITDDDILNFALNLEYLEAQFYTLAVYGVGIQLLPTPIAIAVNGGTAGTVSLKPNFVKVPFSNPLVQAYATETAIEEGKHVSFLQTALGSMAVSMPNLDLYGAFNGLAAAAAALTPSAGLPSTFDPFASDANFLIGAYIFEDVGVSAYHGAAPLIQDKVNILPAAVGIHSVEAYHAGLIRTTISGLDAGSGVLTGYTQGISALRSLLANPAPSTTVDDIGVMSVQVSLNTAATGTGSTATTATPYTAVTIVDAPITTTSIAPGRSTTQIINIVTAGGGAVYDSSGNLLSGTNTGGFFPSGMNGTIGAAVAATTTTTP